MDRVRSGLHTVFEGIESASRRYVRRGYEGSWESTNELYPHLP